MKTIGHSTQRLSPEWYTPTNVIEAARRAMGGIDLDPASCDQAQRAVNASTYYTREQDGLRQKWFGRVWLNPPYGSDLCKAFTMRLALSYLEGKITCGTILLNNTTEAGWFQFLLERFPVLFVHKRIRFWWPDGSDNNETAQGQAIFNVGVCEDCFVREFGSMGVYMTARRKL